MCKVIILSDSILEHCYPPKDTEIIAIRGATIKKIAREVRAGKINVKKSDLCIVHAGTNDIGNNEWDVIIPRYSDLIYELRKQNDQIKIVISGILPRPIDYWASTEITKRANKELKD